MNETESRNEPFLHPQSPEPTGSARWLRVVSWPVVWCMIGMIRFYQRAISPLLGRNCRFTPTCSSYTIQALQKYGLLWGSCKSVWRILRCNPFGKSGIDPP